MARIASACLTVLAVAAAAPVFAQTPPPAAAAPATPAATAPAPMPPAAPEAPPAAAAATPEAAPAAPAPPPAPVTGISARVLQVLDAVCLPMIRQPGTDPKSLAKAVGMRNTRDGWQIKEGGVNRMLIHPPTSVNPSACDIVVNYDVGQGQAIVNALAAWGAGQPQPLTQVKAAETEQGSDRTYTITNWVGQSASTRMGLSFTEEKRFDGSPVAKNADQARVSFSFRALTALDQ